jgi:hypothetical protein
MKYHINVDDIDPSGMVIDAEDIDDACRKFLGLACIMPLDENDPDDRETIEIYGTTFKTHVDEQLVGILHQSDLESIIDRCFPKAMAHWRATKMFDEDVMIPVYYNGTCICVVYDFQDMRKTMQIAARRIVSQQEIVSGDLKHIIHVYFTKGKS